MEYEYNEYYGLATTPNDDYLAHYGVKGMKWGVRKAIASGNSARLGRQYRKAARKLARLEKRAASGSKYAKRAAALGAGAAAAGGLAALGTTGVANVTRGAGKIGGGALRGLGKASLDAANVAQKLGIRGAGRLRSASKALYTAGNKAQYGAGKAGYAVDAWGKGRVDVGKGIHQMASKVGMGDTGNQIHKSLNKLTGDGTISNNTLARAGAGAIGAGLGAGAAYNAYRAATTKRAARKAAEFRKEMNKAFAGTQYANGGGGSRKRRRSRG